MTDPKAHPLIFSAPMILAALDGRKTQTRRVVTPHNSLIDGSGRGVRAHWEHLQWDRAVTHGHPDPHFWVPCAHSLECGPHRITPRYQVGDWVWGKETWRAVVEAYRSYVEYRAGGPVKPMDLDAFNDLKKLALRFPHARKDKHSEAWRSGLYMPRAFSRFERPIVRVGAERVQRILDGDALAEGVDPREVAARGWVDARVGFRHIWDGINGNKPGRDWASNPPVWPIEWGVG
jgi:hypothetical protein